MQQDSGINRIMHVSTTYPRRMFLLAVALFGAAILYAGLGALPLLTLNEARRAVPVEVMHASGDWLLPRLNGDLYLAKPPLFYWFAAAISAMVDRVDEWTLRLPSALSATAILAMCFYVARKYFDRETALATAVVLLTCSTFVVFARRAEIEMLFAALNIAAFLCAHEFIVDGRKRFIYASYAALGFAVLTKGPVAFLFIFVPILLHIRHERARAYLRSTGGWLLLLAIGLSWYAWVTQRYGFDVWRSVVQSDIAEKIYAARGRDSTLTYIQALLLDFLPWSFVPLFTPRRSWREWRASSSARFCMTGVAAPLIIFSLMSDKHIKYLLPAYPLAAILIGICVARTLREMRLAQRRAAIAFSLVLLAGYTIFYMAFERHVYAYRFSALADIREIAHAFPQASLSSYKAIDMRSVYYYGHPIKLLSQADIAAATHSAQPQLVLVERENWLREIDMKGWRQLRSLTPYISKKQTAVVIANPAFFERFNQLSGP